MTWADGSKYEGDWHKGQKHGEGRLLLPNGRIKEGTFFENKF